MLNIFDLLRAGGVKRWHIVETVRDQRLSEHMYNVSLLSGEIARQLEMRPTNIHLVMVAAMFHDIDEVISGDMPTPTKQRLRDAGVEPNDLFKEYQILDTKIFKQLIPDIEVIIKCADHLDTLFFLQTNGLGRHAEQVMQERLAAATKYFAENGRPGAIAADLYRKYYLVKYTI